jgi:hypothetical protein
MKTCPICGSKAAPAASTCFECYYSFAEMSVRDVDDSDLRFRKRQAPPLLMLPGCACELNVELIRDGEVLRRLRSHRASIYVGSQPYNDLALEVEGLSARHLHLYRLEGHIWAELIGNGRADRLIVDGTQRESPCKLRSGSVIKLPAFRLRVS